MTDSNFAMRCAIELSDALLEASRKMKEAQVSISLIEEECSSNDGANEATCVLLDELKRRILTIQGDNIELEIFATGLRTNLILEEKGIDISAQDDEED